MTSQINISNIDVNFPVAGKDNDSQGFRDNFSSIRSGLATAKTEITELQSNSVLLEDLTTGAPVDNDLAGSSINNGYYNNFHGTVETRTVNTLTNIDISAAELHVYSLITNVNFNFTNWPAAGYYAKVKVHFKGDGTGTWTPGLYSEGGGTIVYDNAFPNPFTLNLNGKHKVIEAWTYDGGDNVYVKYLGEF
jgi:hypothetical protein